MSSNLNETIKIYYDRDFNFFVEKMCVDKNLLSDSLDMSSENKRKLAAYYPGEREFIMTTEANSSTTEKKFEQLIKGYNSAFTNITRCYKISSGYKITPIDRSQMPTDGLISREYTGTSDEDKIIAYIKELEKELKKEHYGVFKCPSCEKIQYQLIDRNIDRNYVSCCGCSKKYSSNICVAIYEGDDSEVNRILAVEKCFEEKKEETSRTSNEYNSVGLHPLIYRETVYHISFPECQSLHKALYNNFACEVVFEFKNDGSIEFTDDYVKYLKSLHDNDIRKDLYLAVGKVRQEINSQKSAIRTIERAFYWYINNFDLNDERILVWKVNKRRDPYRFKTLSQYAEAFIEGGKEEKLCLIQLFNDLTCQKNNLFYGYQSNNASEISRLIYETTKQFIYITNDDIIDFGTEFIEQLHLQDHLISARNLFIESIKQNHLFWELITKSSFDILESYKANEEDYYDRLCFYQFAITGKKVLKYKTLAIQNSLEGFKQIKEIVRDAYLIANNDSLGKFSTLIELARNQTLCEKLDKIYPVTEIISFSTDRAKKSIDFESLRHKIATISKESPSIELYLLCIDLNEYKKIKLRFDGRLNDFNGHLKYILDNECGKSLIDMIKRFYIDADVNFFVKFILDRKSSGDYEKFNSDCTESFNKLTAAISKLENKSKTMDDEMRGLDTSKHVSSNMQPKIEPKKSYGSTTPKQNVGKQRKTATPQTKSKTNKGDNNDEWS